MSHFVAATVIVARSCLGEQRQDLPLYSSGDARLALANVNVDFAANPKLAQVNSRLNRSARARDQAARIARFQPIHVDTVAMHALADAVSSAMKKIFAISGGVDDRARRV